MPSVDDRDDTASAGVGRTGGAGGAGASRRRPLDRLLVLAGLCGLAVVQPVLELLGDNPTALQFRDVEGLRIAAFAVAIVVVPPIVLWLVGLVVGLVDARAGWYVHVALVAALFAMVGVLLAKALTGSAPAHVLAAVVMAVGGTLAYLRLDAVHLWLRVLAVANLAFLANFLFLAPVADWITGGTQTAADASFSGRGAGQPASVLMVVLDELPTQSILGDDETIDEVRFPNLARLAEDATWYRHFSTVSPFTQSAVPALLDGQDPHGDPVWTDHPDSLFSLLANSHHLTVSESLTKLCGFEACSGDPQPPADARHGEPPPPPSSPQWAAMLADTRALWSARVTPGSTDRSLAFDDFAEALDAPDTGGAGDGTVGSTADGNGDVVPLSESQQLDGYFASSAAIQPARLDTFLDAIRPTDDPFFAFLHLVMPHQPWFSREDGTRYTTPGDYTGPDITTPWRARVTRQRHLLQAEYTDRLVGQILARMRRVGEYDDTLIVVVSDHGASFEPGESVRSVVDQNLDDIAYAPLLIKEPGQTTGRVDDANLLSVDLVPTIADLLGTRPTWPVDGVAAGDTEALEARGDRKYVYSYTDAFSYEFLGIEEFDDRSAYRAMVDGRFPAVQVGESRLAGLYRGRRGAALIGRPSAGVLGPGDGDALVRALDELRQPDGSELMGEVIGVVPGAGPGDSVVVAVNGTVVGVSPLFEEGGVANQFVVLLPAGALDGRRNRIEVGVLGADGTTAEELDLVGTD